MTNQTTGDRAIKHSDVTADASSEPILKAAHLITIKIAVVSRETLWKHPPAQRFEFNRFWPSEH